MKRKPEEGRYSKVTRRIWNSPDFRALSAPSKPNAQHLFVRLLTGPELGVVPGLFTLRIGGLADEFRWPLAGTRKCLQEIVDRDMAHYDTDAGLVWVPRAINHNAPDNPNVVLGWRTTLKELPACALKERALKELLAWCQKRSEDTGNQDWVNAFVKASGRVAENPRTYPSTTVGGNPSPDPPNNASVYPSANPLGNQEQEQDQEQDPKQQQDLDLAASPRARTTDAAPLRDVVGLLDPTQIRLRSMAILRRMDARHGGGGVYDFGSFRSELERLALKNPEDLERALATYETDPWVALNRGKADPTHFLRRFERYVEGVGGTGGPGGSNRAQRAEDMLPRNDLGVV